MLLEIGSGYAGIESTLVAQFLAILNSLTAIASTPLTAPPAKLTRSSALLLDFLSVFEPHFLLVAVLEQVLLVDCDLLVKVKQSELGPGESWLRWVRSALRFIKLTEFLVI